MIKKYDKLAIKQFGATRAYKINNSQILFYCPKCNRPKLYVNRDTGVYQCFRCTTTGRIKTKVSLADIKKNYIEQQQITENSLNLVALKRKELNYEQIQALKDRGLTLADIKFYNICGRQEDNRIQIPNYVLGNLTDVICAWQYDKTKINNKNPKYLNSEGTNKSLVLFNYHNIENNVNQVILCEGVFNAITAGRSAVASYGCNISDKQCELLIEKSPKSILIAYDSDKPGVEGAIKVIKNLKKLKYNGVVEYILLPRGIDVNDLGHDNFIKYCSTNKIVIDLNSPISIKLPELLYNSKV